MLTTEEIKGIEHAIGMVPYKKAACIDALKIVQEHRRWISDESLVDIANILDMSPEELDSVATFYNLIFRKEVGRHIILICDSISCWVMGYDNLRDAILKKLNVKYGEMTSDGRFTVLPNVCLGTCDCAPAMMIDNDLYQNVKQDELDRILNQYN
jgi:NADH-quinone oxidoreductase subunit E